MESVDIEVQMHATEVEERVRQAVLNIFPDAALDVKAGTGPGTVTGHSRDLETLTVKLRDQKIRATARAVLLKGVQGNGVSFNLNKQAAYVGKVNFTEGDSVLGDMRVTINSEGPEALIDRLTSFAPEEETG